jgi:hypothetical protein
MSGSVGCLWVTMPIDKTESAEIILAALAEGGSLTLLGTHVANGWRSRVVKEKDEPTMFELRREENRQGIAFRSASSIGLYLPLAIHGGSVSLERFKDFCRRFRFRVLGCLHLAE